MSSSNNNGKWLTLSEGLYLMGGSGVNRVEEIDTRMITETVKYRTALFITNVKIGVVKETIEEIRALLLDKQNSV